ncbi:brassinosteroid-responsive RING protein 1-like [Impatiens glandulifera]|uniref:brassinosteroid-responsive RING protein 1-like n=1 Tax=Impatiens glandulifera TaxID=253017 RepID=UPI001FB144FB|nr:brassinosteroid-responsive RING protein 1-like [Impatiens glandulifera]
MGFPVGCTEVFLPRLFIYILCLLGFIKTSISSLTRLLGLTIFLDYDTSAPSIDDQYHVHVSDRPPISAMLIRELLPVMKFEDHGVDDDGQSPDNCAVCLYEIEGGEEIRLLTNCKHIFHRGCLDRWMDHDQMTCPLCRTPFVPYDLRDEFNQRLWAASGAVDPYIDQQYTFVSGL